MRDIINQLKMFSRAVRNNRSAFLACFVLEIVVFLIVVLIYHMIIQCSYQKKINDLSGQIKNLEQKISYNTTPERGISDCKEVNPKFFDDFHFEQWQRDNYLQWRETMSLQEQIMLLGKWIDGVEDSNNLQRQDIGHLRKDIEKLFENDQILDKRTR